MTVPVDAADTAETSGAAPTAEPAEPTAESVVPVVLAESAVRVASLRVEHYPGDALGIPFAEPRLTWTLSAEPSAGARVRLDVARRVPGGRACDEHAILPADAGQLVAWPFAPLVSREEVTVRATLVPAACAAPATCAAPADATLRFEAGLLAEHDHIADIVGPAWAEAATDHRRLPLVRTDVALKAKPVRARLYLSALGLVEAEINGRRVGCDALVPGWTNYGERLTCMTYDVTDHLDAGANAMGFWLGDGWYRGRLGFDGGYANYYGDRIGVFAQLEVEYADGTTDAVHSNSWDRRWKAAPGPIMCADLCEGERYDARAELPGWSEPGFDDADWTPVAEIAYDPARFEHPVASPVRAFEAHRPVSIERIGATEDGRGVWLVDFGQNCSQRIRLHLRGLDAGQSVTLRHVEVLEPDGSIATRTLRRGQQCDVYTSNDTDVWWEPRFAMHGFRYAQIEGYPGTLTAEDCECRVYHSLMAAAGSLTTSDPLLNRLHANAVWSMRSNFVSIPTDCPQRDERMGWTGDICLFAPTATYLYDVYGFLASWLKDMRADQRKWGTVPFYVPFVPLGVWAHPQAISTWGDAAVQVPYTLYLDSGDPQVLAESYELSRDWVDEVAGYLSDDGVWDRRPDFPLGQLGDWLDPSAPPEDPTQAMTAKELVASAFYARSCMQITRIARILGHAEDAARYAALRDRVVAGFLDRFVRADGTMTSDTQCAYALAIAFGLLDADPVRLAGAGERLAALVRESGGKVSTGFAGTPFVLPALSRTGHDGEAYALLTSTACPSWLYQVTMGATTTWERWDSMRPDRTLNPGGMTSFNHYALGSVAAWMHARIGGLEALEPGWRRFRVAPAIGGGLTHASTSHVTPYGTASVAWHLEPGDAAVIDGCGCGERGDGEHREHGDGCGCGEHGDGCGERGEHRDSHGERSARRLVLNVTVPVGTTAVVEIAGHAPIDLTAGTHKLNLPR